MDLKEAFQLLGIPEEVRRAYENKGLKSLYQWQADCLLTTNVLRGDNLLYCAPTSGGKTMVAELILLKTALVLRKQVIFVLPFVSLVFEKEKYLQKLFSNFNRNNNSVERIKVRSYYGGKPIKHAKRAHVMVCTIEKANGLINNMLERGKLKELGCVIVDEAHVISNSLNGYMLEILISKLKYINNSVSHLNKYQMERPIQLIAMSATVGNVNEIGSWLQSKLYISNFRPVPLFEFIKVGNEIYDLDGNVVNQIINPFSGDNDDLGYLCSEAIHRQQQVLVFCPTKAQCSVNCRLLVTVLKLAIQMVPNSVAEQRKAVVAEIEKLEIAGVSYDSLLKESILNGVAYHNSNLDQHLREIIERAYLAGIILVLVATTTLAAGVNLPAGRVIITSMLLGRDPLTIGHYKQMVGRAGRAGHCNFGESFLLVRKAELARAFQLTHQALPNIDSALGPARDGGNAVLRMLIESTGLGLVETVNDAIKFMSQTLFFHLITVSDKESILQRLVVSSINFLRDGYILQLETGSTNIDLDKSIRLILTRLGKALMKAGIDTDEGIIIYEGLFRSQQGLVLDSPLHLLYIISPYNFPLVPNYIKLSSIFDKSAKLGKNKLNSDSEVMTAVGLDFEQLSRWLARPPTYTDVQQSSDLLRQGFLQLFAELCRDALIPTVEEIIPGDASSTATTISTTNNSAQRKKLSHNECKLLCASRRFWCALILRKVLDGFPFDAIATEFQCSRLDIENLIRDARIKLQITKKICDEMGWSAISNILSAFSVELKFDDVKLVGSLLKIEGMTHKMARILVNNGISSVEKVAELSPEDLTQYFMLSLGFHLQDKESINTEFLFDDDSSNSLDHEKKESFRRITDRDEASDGRPTKMAKTEGDYMMLRMDTLTNLLITNAKKIVGEAITGANKSSDKSSVILELNDMHDVDEVALMMALQSADEEHARNLLATKNMKNSECTENKESEKISSDSSTNSCMSFVDSDSDSNSDVDESDDEPEEEEEEEQMDTLLKIHQETGTSNMDDDIILPVGDYEEPTSFLLDENDAPLSIGSAVFTPKSQNPPRTQAGEKFSRETLLTLSISTGRKSDKNYSKRVNTLICESDLADLMSNLESKTDLMQVTPVQTATTDIHNTGRTVSNHVTEFVPQHRILDGEVCWSKFDDISIDISCCLEDSHVSVPVVRLPNTETPCIPINNHVDVSNSRFNNSIIPIQRKNLESVIEGDEINDSILMKLMEDLESNKVNRSTSSTIKPTMIHDDPGHHNNSPVNTTEVSSTRKPIPSIPLTFVHSHARNTMIGSNNQRKLSPYLTPFAASSRHRISYGTYLHLPTTQSAKVEPIVTNNNAIGSGSKVSALFAIENPSTILAKLREESSLHIIETPQTIANLTIGSLNTSSSAFASFLEQVQAKKVFSFELIFREMPAWLLTRKGKKDNNIGDVKLFKLWSFTHFVSQFCSTATNVTCNISDLALQNVIHDYVPGNIKKCPRKGDKYVLSSIILYSGGEQAYHLSLPSIPLIDEREANIYLMNLRSSSVGNLPSNRDMSWSHLPVSLLIHIASYVGFATTLKQSLHLTQYFESPCREKIVNSQHAYDSPNGILLEKNHMWFVCKSWCIAMHIGVVQAWKAGQASPWRFVNNLFRDPSICKMSNHIKNKMQCLRERDIISQGHFMDPAIAFSLLPEEYRDKYDQKYASPRTSLQQKAQQNHQFLHFSRPFIFLERLGLCVATARAVLCWRAVVHAEVFLQKHDLLGIYHNIEMPLTIAVSDMEMNGINIDVRWLREMKNVIEDRLRTIECLVHHYFLNKKKFNLDSVPDVRQIQKLLPSTVLPTSHESLPFRTQQVNDIWNENGGGRESKSDWSAGKSKNPDKERFEDSSKEVVHYPQQMTQIAPESKDAKEGEHLMMALIREHRRHVKLLPMLISLLRNQRKHRVYGYFHQLGTITGRMIASHPPLQQIPKESSFIPSERMTLQHELLHSWNEAKRPPWTRYLEHINNTLRSKNITEDKSFSSKEWVRILPADEVNEDASSWIGKNISDENDVNIAAIHHITEEFSVGMLLEILYTPPPVDATINPGQNKMIFDGFDLDGLVAVVQLGSGPSFNPPSAAVDNDEVKRIVQYPASRVRRVNAAIQATPIETKLFQQLMLLDNCQLRFAHATANMAYKEENSPERIQERLLLSYEYSKLYVTKHVREGFTASSGYVLIAADYSQIELRMLAHLSMDEDLCAAFHSGQDVFKDMASRWLRKPYDTISEVERHRIKQICYSLLYGAGPGLIAANAGVSIEDAEKMLLDFEQKFPGISGFVTSVKNDVQKTGKVRTILGRQRWLPELQSKIYKVRSAGERRAVNTLCQGSAADLIKLAMINIHCKLEEWSQETQEACTISPQLAKEHLVQFRQKRSFPGGGLYRPLDDVRLVLQIHDELVYEVRPEHVERVAGIIRECMEEAVLLHVPLEVKVSVGKSWGSMQAFQTATVSSSLSVVNNPSPDKATLLSHKEPPFSPTDADIFPNYDLMVASSRTTSILETHPPPQHDTNNIHRPPFVTTTNGSSHIHANVDPVRLNPSKTIAKNLFGSDT